MTTTSPSFPSSYRDVKFNSCQKLYKLFILLLYSISQLFSITVAFVEQMLVVFRIGYVEYFNVTFRRILQTGYSSE